MICDNCEAEMTWDKERRCWVCLLCGMSYGDKSEIEDPSYIG